MKRVLIVDDSVFMRQSLRSFLERNDFQVIGEAENGKIGVQKYKELKPDIVTLDITMPQMDGLEALDELKSFDNECKVIIVSAVGHESNVKKAIMKGAKNFIVKPFKEEHILKVLKTL